MKKLSKKRARQRARAVGSALEKIMKRLNFKQAKSRKRTVYVDYPVYKPKAFNWEAHSANGDILAKGEIEDFRWNSRHKQYRPYGTTVDRCVHGGEIAELIIRNIRGTVVLRLKAYSRKEPVPAREETAMTISSRFLSDGDTMGVENVYLDGPIFQQIAEAYQKYFNLNYRLTHKYVVNCVGLLTARVPNKWSKRR